ncbi:MAG: hypothetical protein IH988_04570 [Planctomycetes bacterium]|nr:hypothetical protein [Planctomycetota bacterium]
MYGDVFPDNFLAGADPPHDPWLADFNLDLPEFRCPSDAGFTGGQIRESDDSIGFRSSGMTAYDYFGNSYLADNQVVGIAGGNCTLFAIGAMYRPLSRIPSPTLTILYSEYPARDSARMNYLCASPFPGDLQCDTGYGNSCAYLNPPIEFDYPVHGWHGQESMFNVTFIDGHVDYVSMRGMLRPTPDLGRYPPLAGNPGSGFLYGCVITRNVGWQLEVFPAPPLDTGVPCSAGGGGHDLLEMNL